jgi:hypothetical protein
MNGKTINHRDTETQRKPKTEKTIKKILFFSVSLWLMVLGFLVFVA